MSIQSELIRSFRPILQSLTPEAESYLGMIRRTGDDKFGDYQANFAMPLAKKLGKKPRDVAEEIANAWTNFDLCPKPEVAGPGFLNIRINNAWLEKSVQTQLTDERLSVPAVEKPRTIVIDYSAPNVAKPMHVGHIRSTSIGDALYKILKFLGHNVISDNHLGDWGTQFGMIIWGYRRFLNPEAYQTNPVAELTRIYRLVRQLVDEKKTVEQAEQEFSGAAVEGEDASQLVGDAVLMETSKLHHGDEENLALWKQIMQSCYKEIDKVYSRLKVRFDYTLGESSYQPQLEPLVESMIASGLAQVSEGAVVVFNPEISEAPFLIRKRDGAFIYGTTDLATLEYRKAHFHPDAVLYVVDSRQALHFQQLFRTWRRMDPANENVELKHVSFGTVMGDDGKPFKTRSGDTVGLESLLDEAESAAWKVVEQSQACQSMTEEQRRDVARKVGIGALKYADLSQNRDSDYVFSYEKMLAMNGNTATYMQYAYARVRSIFDKGEIDVESFRKSNPVIVLTQPAERALVIELSRFEEALLSAVSDYRPNQLTSYLFELAARYSAFFERCPVLKAESEEAKTTRLALCDLTARTIQKGLELLGIETVERM